VLPVSIEHALLAGALSDKHKDPFDRMLIAQARIEKLTVISTDRVFKDYDVAVMW
jgi:PIN domain nuclease of toxin-antitoxin system